MGGVFNSEVVVHTDAAYAPLSNTSAKRRTLVDLSIGVVFDAGYRRQAILHAKGPEYARVGSDARSKISRFDRSESRQRHSGHLSDVDLAQASALASLCDVPAERFTD